MTEGLVTPRKTTARYLPGSPRLRYLEAMVAKKETKEAKDAKEEKEAAEAPEETQPDEEQTEEAPPTGQKKPPAKKPPAGGLKRPASVAFAEAKAKVERNDSLREAMVGVSVKP